MKGFKRYNIVIIIFEVLAVIGIGLVYYYQLDWYYKLGSILLFGILTGLIFASLFFYNEIKNNKYQKDRLDLWNSISYRVKNAGEKSFNEMPLAIIIFNDEFQVEWANNYAKEIFQSELVERNFDNLNKDFADLLRKREANFTITMYDKVYRCEHVLADHVIYMTDITNETNVLTRYKQRTLALGILNLDNLDLVMNTMDAQEKSLQMSHLIGILMKWADDNDLCIKGYSEERYMLIMDLKTLEEVMKKEFSVLSDVKTYCEKEGLRITCSIGVVCGDKNSVELFKDAEEKLNIALSRGGNQAVVVLDGSDKPLYYGARSEAFENRTPMYVRAKSEELVQLISKHKNVYIMAHKYMDADAFGACLVASKIAESCKAHVNIIFDENIVDATVKEVYHNIKTAYGTSIDELIASKDAIKKFKADQDLLILVDVQYERLLMSTDLYNKAKHIAIVDHHRRNTDAINNYEYMYGQPSASSSVELLVEMLDFVKDDSFEISPNEATWMIMGVLVDTNNFMFHTTDRTFNVLARLQKYGAELGKAQKYLRENEDEYLKRNKIITRFENYKGYGIIPCDDGIYERSFISKIADDAIAVNSVKATFCIGKYEKNAINISARSLDEENVQVIMEKMGGGGHYTIAACQLFDTTIEEATKRLKATLDVINRKTYTTTRIVLTKDVKGRGVVGDILDVDTAIAKDLIKNELALEATADAIRSIEINNLKEKAKQEQLIDEMEDLKERIEKTTVKYPVKVAKNGKILGSVNVNDIKNKFKEQNNIDITKYKTLFDKSIEMVGTYIIPVQLTSGIVASMKVYVVEDASKKEN